MLKQHLKPYAVVDNIRPKLYYEVPIEYRTFFERDYDRIIRSSAFRRLEYKTQVLANHIGDHYRNRLTHSLEVASIARSLCNNLGLNDQLSESISLCHDIGHSPFGHAGEDELNKNMLPYGGFSHNAHALKILTKLEIFYSGIEGLNLSWEILEGVMKHNGPLLDNIPSYIAEYNKKHPLDLHLQPSLEAQISAISDDIAYLTHDIEDGIRSNIISLEAASQNSEIIYNALKNIQKPQISDNILDTHFNKHKELHNKVPLNEISRIITHELFLDVLETTRQNILDNNISSLEDIANMKDFLATFSNNTYQKVIELKNYLRENLYRSHQIYVMHAKYKMMIGKLFNLYMNDPLCMPLVWQQYLFPINTQSENKIAEIVCDYIAGMTDRYAIQRYNEFYDLKLNT